jgi:hypothetical protein
MRPVARAVLVAALCVALEAAVSGVATGNARRAAAFSCPPTSGAGGIVGTITNVLHSKVYVGSKYVGTTPFPIDSRSRICTDRTGEVVFNLARAKKSLVCIALPSSVVELTPNTSLTAAIEKGRTWCSINPSDGSFAAPIAGLTIKASTQGKTLVGVIVVPKHTARVEVYQGAISLRRYRGKVRLKPDAFVASGFQALVRSNGDVEQSSFKPSNEELVVIAQLRLARPTPR